MKVRMVPLLCHVAVYDGRIRLAVQESSQQLMITTANKCTSSLQSDDVQGFEVTCSVTQATPVAASEKKFDLPQPPSRVPRAACRAGHWSCACNSVDKASGHCYIEHAAPAAGQTRAPGCQLACPATGFYSTWRAIHHAITLALLLHLLPCAPATCTCPAPRWRTWPGLSAPRTAIMSSSQRKRPPRLLLSECSATLMFF